MAESRVSTNTVSQAVEALFQAVIPDELFKNNLVEPIQRIGKYLTILCINSAIAEAMLEGFELRKIDVNATYKKNPLGGYVIRFEDKFNHFHEQLLTLNDDQKKEFSNKILNSFFKKSQDRLIILLKKIKEDVEIFTENEALDLKQTIASVEAKVNNVESFKDINSILVLNSEMLTLNKNSCRQTEIKKQALFESRLNEENNTATQSLSSSRP